MDPITIALLATKGVTAATNFFRGRNDIREAEAGIDNLGGVPNYTMSGDYDRMVNMALNAPQTGLAMAERAYADQAGAAGAYGSRGLGSLNAASRNLAQTTAGLEAQRLSNIQSAIGTRAGADQAVMNANTAEAIGERQFNRDRLYAELDQAMATKDAGIEGLINLGGGLAAGVASAAAGTGFGAGVNSFINPASAGGTGSFSPQQLAQLQAMLGSGVPGSKHGSKTSSSFVTEGPEDHDKLEYLISKMVKTRDGIKLKPVARSTGKERHQVNNDGELTIINSSQETSLQDGYEKDKSRGDGSFRALGRAAAKIFEQSRFK